MKFDFELSAKEAVEKWDKGGGLWTIELGGIGPGYEQTIQVAAIEILRDALAVKDPLSQDEFRALAEKTIHFHDECLLGMSGAQAGSVHRARVASLYPRLEWDAESRSEKWDARR